MILLFVELRTEFSYGPHYVMNWQRTPYKDALIRVTGRGFCRIILQEQPMLPVREFFKGIFIFIGKILTR